MTKSYDLIVIGGGIVGLSAAYRAGQMGARTLLIDRHDAGRATDAGAGILAPESSGSERLWYDLAMDSVAYYPGLIESLAADGVAPEQLAAAYSLCPKLLVAMDDDELKAFEQVERIVLARQEERQPSTDQCLGRISLADARDLLPPLGEAAAVLLQPLARRVDGRLMADVLGKGLRTQGVEMMDASVASLLVENGRVTGARVTSGDAFHADATIIAGGAWSPNFGAQLGVQIPVEPQRGQIIHLGLDGTDTRRWPIVNGFRSHYMVPWPDGRMAVGATRETGSGYEVRTTAAGVREVLSEALRVAPGLADSSIRDIRIGLRPFTHDQLPVLGPIAGATGIYLATGHGPTGLTLGPYSGKLVAEQALGKAIEWDLTPFSAGRAI